LAKAIKEIIGIYHRFGLISECIQTIVSEDFESVNLEADAAAEPGRSFPKLDLLLVDMVSIRGSETTFRQWCGSGTRVVVMAERCFLGDVRMAIYAGASGFLLTRLDPEAFVLSLRLVLSGQYVFPTELTGSIFSREFTRNTYGDMSNAILTSNLSKPDEGGAVYLKDPFRSVLRLVGMGYGNQTIAEALNVPESLVKFLLSSFMKRVGVRNRTQAAVWVVRHGLTADGPEAQDEFRLCSRTAGKAKGSDAFRRVA
jgi:DNA-binding NarL/FixJ family response regulator